MMLIENAYPKRLATAAAAQDRGGGNARIGRLHDGPSLRFAQPALCRRPIGLPRGHCQVGRCAGLRHHALRPERIQQGAVGRRRAGAIRRPRPCACPQKWARFRPRYVGLSDIAVQAARARERGQPGLSARPALTAERLLLTDRRRTQRRRPTQNVKAANFDSPRSTAETTRQLAPNRRGGASPRPRWPSTCKPTDHVD